MSPDDPAPLVGLVAGLGAVGAMGAAAVAGMRRRGSRRAPDQLPPLEQVISERTVRRARLPASSEGPGEEADRPSRPGP